MADVNVFRPYKSVLCGKWYVWTKTFTFRARDKIAREPVQTCHYRASRHKVLTAHSKVQRTENRVGKNGNRVKKKCFTAVADEPFDVKDTYVCRFSTC